MDNFVLSGLSDAASRIQYASVWKIVEMMTMNILKMLVSGTLVTDDELEESAYTVVLRQMTQNFLNRLLAFW